MHIRSYVVALALAGAALVPTIASADTGDELTVIGNPRTTRYYDAGGNYTGSSTTTSPMTVIGDDITVIGNPRATQYYDASGNLTGTSTTTSPMTIIGD